MLLKCENSKFLPDSWNLALGPRSAISNNYTGFGDAVSKYNQNSSIRKTKNKKKSNLQNQ